MVFVTDRFGSSGDRKNSFAMPSGIKDDGGRMRVKKVLLLFSRRALRVTEG